MAHDISTIIHGQRQQFMAVLADSTIEFEREAAFALQLVSANTYLAVIAGNNQDSLRNAITNVAAIGISLNPASKLAYLVPRDGKVCLDISYMGLMHIAQQSGAIVWGQSAIVRDNDEFQLDGIDKPPLHKFNPFGTDRGEIIGAYVVVKTDTGDYLTHAMPISKIYDIRDRSEAWKKGQKGPWKTDAEEMIKKTVIKQAAKMWPRRDRLDSAIHNLNTDGEGITFEQHDRLDDETVNDLIALIEATNTKPEAKAEYAKAVEVCRKAQDTAARDKIKAALIAHGEALDKTIDQQATA
jgi:recombination protein RecT